MRSVIYAIRQFLIRLIFLLSFLSVVFVSVRRRDDYSPEPVTAQEKKKTEKEIYTNHTRLTQSAVP